MGWFDDHPKDQRFMKVPLDVLQFLAAEDGTTREVIVPIFKELSPEEEAAFRKHARDNYVVGGLIKETYHPVWRDEARKMNSEAGKEAQ